MNTPTPGGSTTPVMVQTVTGPVPVAELGMTLPHEHIFNDLIEAFYPGIRPFSRDLAHATVTPATAWLLREDPYSSADNCGFDERDMETIVAELAPFTNAGGRTIINSTTGVGRRPASLVETAHRTGLQIVMSGGWCLSHGDVHTLTAADVSRMTAELVGEIRDGVELPSGERVRVGSIGEIGVGPSFTAAERATLVASCLAQVQTGVPLFIHLPGWQRRGHEVLDIVAEYGVDPSAVVLCHMDPSGKDTIYQREIADRGVWLEFDMIAMDLNFPGEGQSPSVQDTVDAVSGLLSDGHGDRILLSHDMFLKTMWARNGGSGFAYVPVAFLPRLIDAGVDAATAHGLMTINPAALFSAAARTTPHAPGNAS
jgi:phosphotriesterase-related protein